jgi:hypothetical protein
MRNATPMIGGTRTTPIAHPLSSAFIP